MAIPIKNSTPHIDKEGLIGGIPFERVMAMEQRSLNKDVARIYLKKNKNTSWDWFKENIMKPLGLL